jgi:hypothetical protein
MIYKLLFHNLFHIKQIKSFIHIFYMYDIQTFLHRISRYVNLDKGLHISKYNIRRRKIIGITFN